jgi:hypothetical protein
VNPRRADHRVLIIASDHLLAALVGALVEATSLQAAFLRDDEPPEEALNRVRPIAAILLDAATEAAASDLFFARARRRHTPVLLFGSVSAVQGRRAWAKEHKVPAFALPTELDDLQAALEGLLEPAQARARATQRRAQGGDGSRGAGNLVFSDPSGMRWTVYDRRMGDRRAGDVDRRFVSARGQVRHCMITAEDALLETATALNRQLARSVAEE